MVPVDPPEDKTMVFPHFNPFTIKSEFKFVEVSTICVYLLDYKISFK